MTRLLFLAGASLAALAFATPVAPAGDEEQHARVIFRTLFGIEALKERLYYPIQPRIDKVFAYTTAEEPVKEIEAIVSDAAERISADRQFREQILYEYRSAFTAEELAEYARWLESPLGRKLQRFELRNEYLLAEMTARHFRPRVPEVLRLLKAAEEATKPKGIE